jgi:hypothetical protein
MNPNARVYCDNIEDMLDTNPQTPFIVEEYPTIYTETDELDRLDVASVFEEEEDGD